MDIIVNAIAAALAERVVGKSMDWCNEQAKKLVTWYKTSQSGGAKDVAAVQAFLPELDEPAARFVHSRLVEVSISSGVAAFQHTSFESGDRANFETGRYGQINLLDRTTSTTPHSKVEIGRDAQATIQSGGGLQQSPHGLSITVKPGGDPNATVFSVSVPLGSDPNEVAFAIKVPKR